MTVETRWKILREYNSPRKRFCRQHLPHVLFCGPLVSDFPTGLFCKQSPVYGVFDRYFHIPLPIVTKQELGLPFSPRNLSIKFGTNPSTILLVIVVTENTQTDRQTDTQTNAGESVAFVGIIINR